MLCAGSHGSMHPHPYPHSHPGQGSPVAHPSRPFRAVPEAERATSLDLSTMYKKGFPKNPRAAPRSPTAKRKTSLAGQVQVHKQISTVQTTMNDKSHRDDNISNSVKNSDEGDNNSNSS